MAQPGEDRGEKTNFVARAERVFERGDWMISKTFSLSALGRGASGKNVFRSGNTPIERATTFD